MRKKRTFTALFSLFLLFTFMWVYFHPSPKWVYSETYYGKISEVQEKKPLPVFLPTTLEIPAVHLKTKVEPVGIEESGRMGVPKLFDRVGILSPWTKPGEKGNAVIAGHVDHYTGPAVFYPLKKLKSGDEVIVSDSSGKKLTYVVKKVEAYKTEEAPLETIFGKADQPKLNLITCTGRFDKKRQEHAKRLVVFTELAS